MKEVVNRVGPGGVDLDGDFDCLELVKAIYGIKQTSRVWNDTFDECVCSIGFQASAYDPCLYIKIVDAIMAKTLPGSRLKGLTTALGIHACSH
ncbi:hypothetical protein PC110_g18359 [Phytophthora cactorum]|uniref:Reverse transcriptase Ty1/copia-type domain-containing protein n=1 Tax=Phytophthora cactorum TaxID=29920 RepID=A0A329RQ01_9STRA|nr:hypothetical protein PC110_g18359 [Phytophthora cactorum]